MKAKNLVLPGMALGAAALLLVPGQEAQGFSLIGGLLNVGQRDVRLFNNFADAAANNNTTPHPMYPGAVGAEMAVWKAIAEWGSLPHGDGTGDPFQSTIGSGGANFDAFWAGNTGSPGNSNQNIVSAVTGCTGSTIAFTETPISDGWRIRFCDNLWNFDDGPGNVSGAFDIQGIMVHEYGHALGLGHSSASGATMLPSAASGSESERSINSDDIAGVQFIYGAASASKPVITDVEIFNGGTKMTIKGSNFSPSDVRVWLTSASSTPASFDPRVQVSNLISLDGGTAITLTIPASAGPGDVVVRNSGSTNNNSLVSNAFPSALTDTVGGPAFSVSGLTPSMVDVLVPGTDQFLTISGSGLSGIQSIALNPTTELDPSSYTIVNDSTITVDLPQTPGLGTYSLKLYDGATFQNAFFDVVATATPKLQAGTGDPLNFTQNGSDLRVLVSGPIGTQQRIFYSNSSIPSSVPIFTVQLGNNFTQLFVGPTFTIPGAGYFEHLEPVDVGGANLTFFAQAVDITTPPSPAFATSNLQSIVIGP